MKGAGIPRRNHGDGSSTELPNTQTKGKTYIQNEESLFGLRYDLVLDDGLWKVSEVSKDWY